MTAPVQGRLFDGLVSVFSFLTILPMPQSALASASLHGAARSMHLFPVVGAVLGLLLGLLAWGLFEVTGQPLLAGLLAAAAVLIVTGLHHTDGLSDFADGLMARGTRGRRLKAMKDRSTGTAGTTAIVLNVAGLIIVLSIAGGDKEAGDGAGISGILIGVLLGEVLAKFSMVVMATTGRPASAAGTGALFIEAMKDRRKVAAAALVTVPIMIILGWPAGVLMLAAAVIVPAVLARLSARAFGGVTGDVFGASNDMVRIASLAVFVSV